MNKIGLRAIGAFVPPQTLTNQDLEKMVDTTDDWIVRRTGIRERRIAPKDLRPSEMACAAAQNCLAGLALAPELVVNSSGTGERISPYQASLVANRLNLKNPAAFDINAACSGFIYGLAVAASLMKTAGYAHALVTACEKMSDFTDYRDRRSCILFGDGAASVLLSAENWEHELIATELGSDPSGAEYVKMGDREGDHFFWQDGARVFKFAVNKVNRLIDRFKTEFGLTGSQNFYVVPHQDNLRIVQAVATAQGIPLERFVMNIVKYGNTSSASVGLALEEAWKNHRFQKGDFIFLIAFGGGLSWAGAVIRW